MVAAVVGLERRVWAQWKLPPACLTAAHCTIIT